MSSPRPEAPPADAGAFPRPDPIIEARTVGELVRFLETLDGIRAAAREANRVLAGTDLRAVIRNELAAQESRWRPREKYMPGISQVALLCDLEPGEPGVNLAKVRALRARLVQRTGRSPEDVDALTLAEAADLLSEPAPERVPGQTRPIPHWDETARVLTFGGRVCKRYSRPAPNQETILAGFQELGWPDAQEAPLSEKKFAVTIDSLNNKLEHIRFRLNVNGTGVVWEPV